MYPDKRAFVWNSTATSALGYAVKDVFQAVPGTSQPALTVALSAKDTYLCLDCQQSVRSLLSFPDFIRRAVPGGARQDKTYHIRPQ
jgi:hypothetical protein